MLFAKIMYVFFLLLFTFVFVADYKTWSSIFTEPIRLKKIRKDLKKKEKSDV